MTNEQDQIRPLATPPRETFTSLQPTYEDSVPDTEEDWDTNDHS